MYDPDSGLVRFGARDFDSITGKWLAKDLIGFEAFDTNLHSYVFQDPINATDSSGLIAPVAAAIAGGIIGAASGFAGAISQDGYTPGSAVVGTLMGAVTGAVGAIGFTGAIAAAGFAMFADAEGQLVAAAATPCGDRPNFSSLIGAGLGGAKAEVLKRLAAKQFANASPWLRAVAAIAPSLPASILPILGSTIGRATGF